MNNHLSRACFLLAGLSLSAKVLAAPPVAVDDTRNIAVDSIGIINVLANDFDSDGDALSVVAVGEAQNGQASLNGDGSISYVPSTGFVGVDQFTYTIQEQTEEALTTTAIVTVTVFRRETQNAVVNSPQVSIAESIDVVCTRLRALSDAELGAVRRNLLERCNALSEIAVNNPDALPAVLRQISPDEISAISRVSRQFGRTHTFSVRQRLGQRRSGINAFTFNGIPASDYNQETGGTAGSEGLASPFGFFISAGINNAEKDTSELEVGYDSDSGSLTAGIDYRVNNNFIIGSALGFSDAELEFSSGNGQLDSEEASLLVFGSYSAGGFSYDLQLGYIGTRFSTTRNINYDEGASTVSDSLSGSTGGTQLLFNNLIQWSWNKNALSIFPFFKLDYLSGSVKAYSEQGNSGLPMSFSKQNSELIVVGVGTQASYALGYDWGVWLPSIELAFNSEIDDGSDPIEARFAFDTDNENTFFIENDGGDSAYLQIALTSSFTFKRGASAFLQYQQLAAYEGLTSNQLSGGLRFEF